MRLTSRLRTLTAAALGLALVGIPACLGVYWQVSVVPKIEDALATRLGRRVWVGAARPRLAGVRLVDVVIYGSPPFEKVPLLQASAVDVDVRWGKVLRGQVSLEGLLLKSPRMAVVRDGRRGTDNVGELTERLFRGGSGRERSGRSSAIPVHVQGGSLEIAYRDSGGADWVVRVDDLAAHITGGSGTVQAERIRLESYGAAAEFGDARFAVEGGKVQTADAAAGRLLLAGAANLIADATLRAVRSADGWQLRVRSPRAKVFGEFDSVGVRLTLDADRLSLGPLRALGDSRGIGTTQATLDAHLDVRFRPREDALGAEGRIEISGVTITNPRVTTGAIHDARMRIAGSIVAAPRAGRIAVGQSVVRMGELAVWVRGALEGAGHEARGDLEIKLEQTPCQTALASLPPGLAPVLEGAALGGTLAATGKLRVDMAHLDDLALDLSIKDRCTVLRDPPRADVTRLRASGVSYSIEDEAGRPRAFPLGPENPDWRPLSSISPHLQGAFLTAEDARFFSHNGFEPEYIRRAVIENLKKGRVVRGASTISQQLVKNLYLEKARTWSRKLQEAALTWRLEQAVPKKRILELYLNAIELGPGTFGVRQASRRYFGKEPRALSPLEAAHVASVAPNPKGYWARFRRESVGDDWMEKLYDLLGMMHRSHRLSDGDFAQAVKERLQFAEGG